MQPDPLSMAISRLPRQSTSKGAVSTAIPMSLNDEQSPEGSELVDAAKMLHQPKVASGHQRSVGRGDRGVDPCPALRAWS
jgi:hypothetical protein